MRFARFIVVGAANTAASYLVYLALLQVIDYRVAYTAAYIAGLALGYWAHATFVFDARVGVRSALAYLVTYGLMYLVSLAVLAAAVGWVGIPKPAAMLAALCVTVPASFLLLRRGFRSPSP